MIFTHYYDEDKNIHTYTMKYYSNFVYQMKN